MINKVILVGRLTSDPQLRKTGTGVSVVTFTVACNRRFAAQGQERQADFINCVAWRQTADFMSQYVQKGTLVGVEGRIQTRNYDDQTGKRVYVTEVVADNVQILSRPNSQNPATNQGYQNQGYQADYNAGFNAGYPQDNSFEDFNTGPTLDISSDDLPF